MLSVCLLGITNVQAGGYNSGYENALHHDEYGWMCPVEDDDSGPRQSRMTGVGGGLGILSSGVPNQDVAKWGGLAGSAMEFVTQMRNQHLTQRAPKKRSYGGMPEGYAPAVYVDYYKKNLCPIEGRGPILGKTVYPAVPVQGPAYQQPAPSHGPVQGPPMMPNPQQQSMIPIGQVPLPTGNGMNRALKKIDNLQKSSTWDAQKPLR
jgi:hypothetical protein